MNAVLVYVMVAEGIFAGFSNGWYDDDPHNALVCFLVMLYTYILILNARRIILEQIYTALLLPEGLG